MQPSDYVDPFTFVVAVVATFAGISREAVTKTSGLCQELGIYGDDAEELVPKLCAHRQIDLTGFRFEAFFPSEPTLLTVGARLLRRKRTYRPLTVAISAPS